MNTLIFWSGFHLEIDAINLNLCFGGLESGCDIISVIFKLDDFVIRKKSLQLCLKVCNQGVRWKLQVKKNDKFVNKGVMYFDVKNVQHDTVSVGFIKVYKIVNL